MVKQRIHPVVFRSLDRGRYFWFPVDLGVLAWLHALGGRLLPAATGIYGHGLRELLAVSRGERLHIVGCLVVFFGL